MNPRSRGGIRSTLWLLILKSSALFILEPGRPPETLVLEPDCERIWLVTVPRPPLVTLVLLLTELEDEERTCELCSEDELEPRTCEELPDWRTCEDELERLFEPRT